MDTVIGFLGSEAKTVAFAIFSGIVAFVAKVIYDLRTAQRKERLERVNQQLKLLYGPLYALDQSGRQAWTAFRAVVRPGQSYFRGETSPTERELSAWRLWMSTVFRQNHEEMLSIITKNADLLIEPDLPPAIQMFCAHVASYKAVFAQWEKGDYSEHTAVVRYPGRELSRYLESSFKQLKAVQASLLGNK